MVATRFPYYPAVLVQLCVFSIFTLVASSIPSHAQLNDPDGTKQVSVSAALSAPDGLSQEAAAPPEGDFFLFSSNATNLSPLFNPNLSSPTNNIYLSRRDQLLDLVSTNFEGQAPYRNNGQALEFGCYSPAVSKLASHGSFAIAFTCDARDLVREFNPPNNENPRQIYVKFYSSVTAPGTTILASGRVDGISTRGGNGISDQPTIALVSESPLRYRLCFRTRASDLLSSGTTPLVYPEVVCEVIDHDTASVVAGSRLSVKPNLTEPDGLNEPSLSADGSILAFSSTGTIIPGLFGNGSRQVYTYSFASSEISLISYKSDGSLSAGSSSIPSLSSNGSAIAFQHQPTSNGLDLKGLDGGVEAVFVVREGGPGSGFRQVNTSAAGVASDASSAGGMLHASSRFAVFFDRASNLLGISGDNPQFVRHAYIKDLATGEIGRADVTPQRFSGNDDAGIALYSYIRLPLTIGRSSVESSLFFVGYNSGATNLATLGVPNSEQPYMYVTKFNVVPDTPTPTPTATITPTATLTPTVTPTSTPDPSGGPAITLTRNIKIDDPPAVQVTSVNPDGSADILIVLRKFRLSSTLFGLSGDLEAFASSKATLTYHVEIRKQGSKFRLQKVISRNTTTVRKLKPGTYTVRYRVVATKGSKKVQSRLSPSASFTIT